MILKVQPTGMIVNEINIQCLVDFQLTPLSGAPFRAEEDDDQPDGHAAGRRRVALLVRRRGPTLFAVGMPDGLSQEQVAVFREFGIPHPLDQQLVGRPGRRQPAGLVAVRSRGTIENPLQCGCMCSSSSSRGRWWNEVPYQTTRS